MWYDIGNVFCINLIVSFFIIFGIFILRVSFCCLFMFFVSVKFLVFVGLLFMESFICFDFLNVLEVILILFNLNLLDLEL